MPSALQLCENILTRPLPPAPSHLQMQCKYNYASAAAALLPSASAGPPGFVCLPLVRFLSHRQEQNVRFDGHQNFQLNVPKKLVCRCRLCSIIQTNWKKMRVNSLFSSSDKGTAKTESNSKTLQHVRIGADGHVSSLMT